MDRTKSGCSLEVRTPPGYRRLNESAVTVNELEAYEVSDHNMVLTSEKLYLPD